MEYTKAIGLMSGTSCDGLDIAACTFEEDQYNKWNYQLIYAETIEYDVKIKKLIEKAISCSGYELLKINNEFGIYLGEKVLDFINKSGFVPDIIATHGHTVFHRPSEGITFQLGNPLCIAKITKIMVIGDFRTSNVLLGGQGAPLVPIGDELLFKEYDACLNLGGFANISFNKDNKRIAFDICPVNIVLNYFSKKVGMDYDNEGFLARNGKLEKKMFDELNNLSFYKQNYPKSLGREWVEEVFFPIVKKFDISIEDILHTLVEHISDQISEVINKYNLKTILITGGGVYNKFLVESIKNKINATLVIPDDIIIKYKEALIFAFLGVLRFKNKINCLSSYTGSIKDHITGSVFLI